MSPPPLHIWSPTLGSSKVVTHESQSFPELKALKGHESDTDKLNGTGSWSIYDLVLSCSLAHAAWHAIAFVSMGLPQGFQC